MRIASVVIGVGALLGLSQVVGQEQVKTEAKKSETSETVKFNFWMNVKLTESQKLLAALSKADFDALIASSQTLDLLNTIEGFTRKGTPGYRTQLRTFEFALDEIEKQAKQENIEGVTLGFHQLTLSCVNCHKQIRQLGPATPSSSGNP